MKFTEEEKQKIHQMAEQVLYDRTEAGEIDSYLECLGKYVPTDDRREAFRLLGNKGYTSHCDEIGYQDGFDKMSHANKRMIRYAVMNTLLTEIKEGGC